MKKGTTIAVALLLITGLWLAGLTGCDSDTTPQTPAEVTIQDQLGRTITLEGIPETIISLAPSNTEILFALGLADKVIAVTNFCNYPSEATAKPSIGGFSTPNIEEIIAMGPDLILAADIHKSQIIPRLEEFGLNVLALAPKTMDEAIAAIQLVGEVTGVKATAEALTTDMRSRIDAVKQKTAGLSGNQLTRVLYVVWHEPLMASGSGTFHDEMIRISGGFNIAGELSGYATISLESVIGADPQVIMAGVDMGDGEDLSLQYLQNEPRLSTTEARKTGAVYPIDMDVVGRTGPRIVDALEQFAVYIHPELFTD